MPDVIGSKKGREIYIEFAVTHFVDIVKIEKIKKLSTPAIEIFIGNQVLDKELLSEFFMSRSFEKYWLFNPKQDELYRMSLALIENRQQENANLKRLKLKTYSNTPGIRVLQVGEDGWIENCPKKSVALLSMKNSAFYTHQVLKRIIDGEFWNGKIYGYENQGKYIFLQNQKIYVYPPSKSNEIESVGNKSSNLFFAGLHSILEVLENREFGDCPKCQYSKDNFEINKDAYEICAHP